MTRKSHIKRVIGKSKSSSGEPVDEPDVYVDVARIDTLDTVEWPGAQENQINLQWKDAPGDDGNPGRRMGNVRLLDPEETNRDDPAVWIDLPVIERMTLVRHPGAQQQVTSFQPSSADPQADELETARRVAIRRVTHAESNVDAQLDDNGYLADADDYTRKADAIDDTQYLDVEIIESYPSTLHQGPSPQEVLVSLINDDLKEMFSAPPNDAKRNPVRLDPFQNIVNVQWGGGATEFEVGSNLARTLSVSNPNQISIVLWIYLDDLERNSQLLQFGPIEMDDPHISDLSLSSVYVDHGLFGFAISGVIGSVMTKAPEDGGPAGGPFPATPALIGGLTGARQGWNFIGLSVDTSSGWAVASAVNIAGARSSADANFICSYFDLLDQLSSDNRAASPQFEIALTDGELAVPIQIALVGSENYPIEKIPLAAVQIWSGQFLDFSQSSVLDKFMKPDVDDPTKPLLVNTSVAQAEFGKPTFFFDGPPARFATNKGSGGEFIKTGELNPFRPGPPKAPAPTP